MALLELDGVFKSFGRGSRTRVVLRAVSMELDLGELVSIWGVRQSGRSTLLRVAAGLERPDAGEVRFDGVALTGREAGSLRDRIAFCRKAFGQGEGGTVFERIVESQVVRGAPQLQARARAHRALERAAATDCGPMRPTHLDGNESIRVAIARALACEPQLLVIDDPLLHSEPEGRDHILELLRRLADEGMAVLTNSDRAMGLASADRALALGEGSLRGETAPELAEVIEFRRQRSGAA